MDPSFLDISEILRIQLDQVRRYGGSEGLRDPGLLESAMAMAKATFGGKFLHKDLFEMAAAYLFHIIKDHPFLDGNKRTGAAAAVTFLKLNGCEPGMDDCTLESSARSVAEGNMSKEEAANVLRESCEQKKNKA